MKKSLNRFASAMPFLCCLLFASLFTLTGQATGRGMHSLSRDTIVIPADEDSTCNNEGDSVVVDSTLSWPQNVRAAIDRLVDNQMFERSQLGMFVFDLTADSAIYEYGKRQLMRPASVEKLLTTITALNELGGSFQFTTRLYCTGEVKDSTLCGDVYVKGGFDPRFGNDDMQAFVEALKEKGIKKIGGEVLTDMSLKDTQKYGEGWCWDDEAPILRPLLYEGCDEFVAKFFERLTEYGIALPASYGERLVPDSAKLMVERSHTMDQILMRLLKNSDNLYAEALFYQLGAKAGEAYLSAKASAKKVNELIQNIGLNPDDYNVADGCGLSLYDYTTPEVIVKMLKYAWQRNNIYLHLFPSLPVAGVDGTLSHRMRSGTACGNVHAKTGTVRGVSSLAGYMTAANKHLLCFCIFNQGIRSNSAAHHFQDKVCQILSTP